MRRQHALIKDGALIFLSLVCAVFLIKTPLVGHIFSATKGREFVGSFIGGIFFTSIFTAAPATVVLGEIASENSPYWTAFFGACGALVGDYLIFRLVRDSLSEHMHYAFRSIKKNRFIATLKIRKFGWFSSIIGAIIIASPLPDEIGLTLMGLSKVKTSTFIPLSFALNFVGILLIGLIVKKAA